jgi:DNA invertase Pin-like site-specific DNA recombinase
MRAALYIRRSTSGQLESLNRQKLSAEGIQPEDVYADTCSGTTKFFDRPAVQELLRDIPLKGITTVHVHELSRLGRNLRDILETVSFFTEQRIQLLVKKENIRLLDENGKVTTTTTLLISILGLVAQLEREMTLDRQREGIAIAKLQGKFLGRKPGSVEGRSAFLEKPKVRRAVELLREQRLKQYEIAKLVGLSPNTVTKISRLM